MRHHTIVEFHNANRFSPFLLLLTLVLSITLVSCKSPFPPPTTPTPTVTATLTIPSYDSTATTTPTPIPTATPIPAPLGEPDNPVVLGMVYTNQEVQEPAAVQFLQYLADQTGLVYQISLFENTFDMLAAMDTGNVTFAFMQPLTYIYAHQNEVATVKMITRSFGVTAFGTQLLVKSDSGFTTYFDEENEKNLTDSPGAVTQFSGKRPCFIDETSVSGTIVPMGLLAEAGVVFSDPVYMLSNTSVIRALYIGGICDFGATYAISSDPRTSTSQLEDLPDVMEKIQVVWRSDAIIPTLNFSFANKSNPEVTSKIVELIKEYAKLETGPQALSDMTGYQLEGVEDASDSLYTRLTQLVTASGIDLVSYLGY